MTILDLLIKYDPRGDSLSSSERRKDWEKILSKKEFIDDLSTILAKNDARIDIDGFTPARILMQQIGTYKKYWTTIIKKYMVK